MDARFRKFSDTRSLFVLCLCCVCVPVSGYVADWSSLALPDSMWVRNRRARLKIPNKLLLLAPLSVSDLSWSPPLFTFAFPPPVGFLGALLWTRCCVLLVNTGKQARGRGSENIRYNGHRASLFACVLAALILTILSSILSAYMRWLTTAMLRSGAVALGH